MTFALLLDKGSDASASADNNAKRMRKEERAAAVAFCKTCD